MGRKYLRKSAVANGCSAKSIDSSKCSNRYFGIARGCPPLSDLLRIHVCETKNRTSREGANITSTLKQRSNLRQAPPEDEEQQRLSMAGKSPSSAAVSCAYVRKLRCPSSCAITESISRLSSCFPRLSVKKMLSTARERVRQMATPSWYNVNPLELHSHSFCNRKRPVACLACFHLVLPKSLSPSIEDHPDDRARCPQCTIQIAPHNSPLQHVIGQQIAIRSSGTQKFDLESPPGKF